MAEEIIIDSSSIDDVEDMLMKHWNFLYAANPDWFEAERLRVSLKVEAEVIDPMIALILPEMFTSKRKRDEDEPSEVSLWPVVSYETESKVKVLKSVNEVLKPRKIESDWKLKRRLSDEKAVLKSKKDRVLSKSRRDMLWLVQRQEEKERDEIERKEREVRTLELRKKRNIASSFVDIHTSI